MDSESRNTSPGCSRMSFSSRHGLLVCAFVASCASQDLPPASEPPPDSVVAGTIGVVVTAAGGGVVVAAMRPNGRAKEAGLRVGDVVHRYNGVSVLDPQQFYRLVLDSMPGSRAELELVRDGSLVHIAVPVEETDTALRG